MYSVKHIVIFELKEFEAHSSQKMYFFPFVVCAVLFIDSDYKRQLPFISVQYMMKKTMNICKLKYPDLHYYLHHLGSPAYCNLMLSILPSPSFETLMMMLPVLGVHCVLPASLVLLSLSLVPHRMMCVSPILPTPREKRKENHHTPRILEWEL